jgi:hypothetical protein
MMAVAGGSISMAIEVKKVGQGHRGSWLGPSTMAMIGLWSLGLGSVRCFKVGVRVSLPRPQQIGGAGHCDAPPKLLPQAQRLGPRDMGGPAELELLALGLLGEIGCDVHVVGAGLGAGGAINDDVGVSPGEMLGVEGPRAGLGLLHL